MALVTLLLWGVLALIGCSFLFLHWMCARRPGDVIGINRALRRRT